LVVLLIGVTGVVFADDSYEEISVTFSSRIYSKYLGSYTGRVCDDDPSLQNDLFITLPKGFYLEIWNSIGLDGTGLSSDYGDELDYLVGWSGKLEEINLNIGIAYIDCIDLFESPRGDLILPYLEINKEFDVSEKHCLTPYLGFEFPFSAKGNEFGHGFYTRVGLKHDWQISPKLVFNQKINLFFDDGALGDSGILGQYCCDLSWQISKPTTIDLISIKAIDPLTSLSDGRKAEMVYGTGMTYRF